MNNQIQLVLKSSTTEMSLNNHELGIYIVPELDGLTGLPEIRTTSGVNAGYDGGWTSAQNFDARSITIRGVIANTDIATVERLRKQLVSLLAQGKNEQLTLNLVTQAGNSYELEVRTIACEMAMQRVLTQQEFMIQLRADDPLIYDGGTSGESVIVQVQQAIGGFQINFELPLAISGGEGESTINNGGLEQVYPIIKMYGALHNPTFVNQTTNQQFQVNATLGFADGAWHTPSELYEGTTINIPNAPDNAPLASFQLDGETSQNGTPTPSAPVPVNTTTGENVVKICGKNLYNETATPWVATTHYNTTTGAIEAWANYYGIREYQPVSASTQYVVSSAASGNLQVVFYDGSKTFLSATSGSPSFTTPANCQYVRWSRYTETAPTNTQLELGSATAYEPYQGQSYEVNLASKNMLDMATLQAGYINGQNGSIVENSDLGEMCSGFIKVEPSTVYTIEIVETSGTEQNWFGIGEYSASSTSSFIRRDSQVTGTTTSYTFTTASNCQYVRASARNLVTATKVQLEKGSTPTTYVDFWQIELCKIGTYQDSIYKSSGKWYLHKEVGSYTFDGSETWSRSGSTTSTVFVAATGIYLGDYIQIKIGTGPQSLFDRFTFNNQQAGAGGRFNLYNGTDYYQSLGISFDIADIPDITAAKAWLASNTPTLYGVLATPTDTEITNEALVAQLEAVLAARTYAGANNIFTVTPNEQGTLEISYMTEKDADKRDVMVVDSRMRTVTLNGADIYHLIAAGSEFPMLAPGENKLLLRSDTPGDNGYADVNYKQGYLTI